MVEYKLMRNPEQTRLKLIATATQLLLIKGVEGLRVDQVASMACVNKRMIYHYFEHKEGLHQAVLHSQVRLLADRADLLSTGAKAFLVNHFTLLADKAEIAKETPKETKKKVQEVAQKKVKEERREMNKTEHAADNNEASSAAHSQQSLQDAGVIVLRALLGQRQFATRLNSKDWASLVQGLMALGLPQLSEVDEAAVIIEKLSGRTPTEKPRYTLQAKLRYSQ
jgi:AcrR family transcriptional regulator